jgi:hypothetical protein
MLTAAVILALAAGQAPLSAGEKDKKDKKDKEAKVHEVGKDGLKINGELKGEPITYQVKLVKGTTYVIDMISADQMSLDPFLYLRDADDKLLAEDDDGGEGLNSRIEFTAEAGGTYRLIAGFFGDQGRGQFTLTVREKK